MNETVTKIVNLMFRDTVDTEETRELHDEIMINCQEHFRDLTQNGMSEQEALSIIMDSLRGMEEVIAAYPRKSASEQTESSEETTEQEEEEIPDNEPRPVYVPIGDVRKLNVKTSPDSVEITCIEGNAIEIYTEDMDPESLQVQEKLGVLTIECVPVDKDSPNRKGSKLNIFESLGKTGSDELDEVLSSVSDVVGDLSEMVGNILHKVGNCIREACRSGGKIHIGLPDILFEEIAVKTVSGNISVDKVEAASLKLSSVSGAIDVDALKSGDITAHSTSGNVNLGQQVQVDAGSIKADTMSGNVMVEARTVKEEISTLSGKIQVIGVCERGSVHTTSGDVEIDASFYDMETKSVSGDTHIRAESADLESIHAHSTSGDISLVLPADVSEVHGKCKSTSGSVQNKCNFVLDEIGPCIEIESTSGDISVRYC